MFDEKFLLEFFGGSQDGALIEAKNAPICLELAVNSSIVEIYERQTRRPPFIYVQAGYAPRESWRN
ncbi:MAG TPA: hypothetical protein VHY22_06405 [Chthoniobacteraceae bacterium]|jgi:hypothetical protein|nr:hypothetical protein [Chthoniobacteraceae bacterium]